MIMAEKQDQDNNMPLEKMNKKEYEKELARLQVELVKLTRMDKTERTACCRPL